MKTNSAVRCVICRLTFLSVNAYLHPTHRCVVVRHPSQTVLAKLREFEGKGPA